MPARCGLAPVSGYYDCGTRRPACGALGNPLGNFTREELEEELSPEAAARKR